MFTLLRTIILLQVVTLYACNSQDDLIKVTVSEGTNMSAALSPDRKMIVIALQGTLWTLPASGGDAVAITDEFGDCHEPDWSPDGSKIAFHSYRDGNYHIWMLNKDGSDLVQLTSGISDNREPHWSPDGKKIVFSSDRSGNYDIWELDVSNKSVRQITTDKGNDSNPAYSPSGRSIAFVSQRSDAGIYVIDNGNETLAVPFSMRIASPSWSNDSILLFVAFTSKSMLFDDRNTSYIYSANIMSGKHSAVTDGSEDIFPFRIAYANGNAIIYTADGKIKKRRLDMRIADDIPFQATFLLQRKAYARKTYDFDNRTEKKVLGIAGPVISPDGTRIAFASLGDIYFREPDGKVTRVTNGSSVELEPAWSQDGRFIAYVSDRSGRMEVWVRNLKTGNDVSLCKEDIDAAAYPSWSPDGKKVAFYTLDYKKKWGQAILHVVDVKSSSIKKFAKPLYVPGKATWSPDSRQLCVMALSPHSTRFREGFNSFMFIDLQSDSIRYVSPDPHSPLSVRNQNGPIWSPDGSRIAYVRGGVLWTVPVNSSGDLIGVPEQLTEEIADNISWAADSKTIAYLSSGTLKKIQLGDRSPHELLMEMKYTSSVEDRRYIVHAGKVFNAVDSTYHENVDLVINGNRIESIAPHSSHPEHLEVVDCSKQVLMPGLFEMHTHQSSTFGELLGKTWLAYGITTVREPGADPYEALERKESWESGARIGPRLFFTGGLADGSRIAYGLTNSVTEPHHVKLELDRAEKLGYDLIKTYVRMPDSIQKQLTEGAHALGIPITSHELYPATKYNVDGIEHLSGTSRRGYSLLLDANFRSYEDVVKLIAMSGINLTPTACLRTGFFRLAKTNSELIQGVRNERFLSAEFLESLKLQVARADSGRTTRGDDNYKALLATLKKIVDAGGSVTTGTDAPFAPLGSSLHTEMWIMVDAGVKPYKALQAATINAAKVVGVDKDLGTLEAGKLADIVIVDGDPLNTIQDAMKVRLVIKNGKVYSTEELIK